MEGLIVPEVEPPGPEVDYPTLKVITQEGETVELDTKFARKSGLIAQTWDD